MQHFDKKYEYDAFISYRHIPRDSLIAEKLHVMLEAYRTPSYLVRKGVCARLKKVFRDREELPTSSDLGHDIEEALKASRYLIVICSPEAVQSQWVLREVEFFGNYHGYDKILTLLVDGEPKDAFPPELIRYQYDDQGTLTKVIEPLAADIRASDGVSSLKLLKTEKLRIIAGILGCKYDELRQRENERKVRRIISLSVSVAAFLLAVTAFMLWQLNEVNKAREASVYNENLAKEERNNALSTQSSLYSALAKKAADSGDYLLGMSIALEALPKNLQAPEKPLTQEAMDALYYSTVQYGMQERTFLYPPEDTANELALWCFSKQTGGDVVTVGSRVIRQFSPATGRLSHEWMTADGYEILAVSPDGERAVIASYLSGNGLDVQLWDIMQDRMAAQQIFSLGDDEEAIQYSYDYTGLSNLVKAGFEPGGKRFFVACNEYDKTHGHKSNIYLFDSHSGAPLDFPPLSFDSFFGDILLNHGRLVVGILAPDTEGQNLYVYHVENKELVYQLYADTSVLLDTMSQYRGLGITSDGKKLAFASFESGLHIVNMDTGEHQQVQTEECIINNDGDMAAFFLKDAYGRKRFIVLDLVQSEPIVILENSPSFTIPEIQSFIFCSNDRYILYRNSEMLDIRNGQLYMLPLKDWFYADSDPDGTYLAYLDRFGTGAAFQLTDSQVHETVVSSRNQVAVRNGGILLFEDEHSEGTIIRKWDAVQKTIAVTDFEESDISSLCDINGGFIGYEGYSRNLGVYSMETGRAVRTLIIDGHFNDFQVDPSDNYVLVNMNGINDNDGIYLLDAHTGQQIRQLSTSDINGAQASSMRRVGFFPDGKHCWSANYHEPETEYTGIVFYDVGTGEAVSRIPMREDFSDFSASVSPDGSRMVVQPLHVLQLWSVEDPKHPSYMCDLQGNFLCMDDSVVVTDDQKVYTNTLYIYDIKTGRQKVAINNPAAQGYKGLLINGGKNLLTITKASNKWGSIQLMLWDCNTGKAVATLYNDYLKDSVILDFGLVNDGKELVIISECRGKTYIRAIPFLSSFDQVYDLAEKKLSGRRFDAGQDMEHLQ